MISGALRVGKVRQSRRTSGECWPILGCGGSSALQRASLKPGKQTFSSTFPNRSSDAGDLREETADVCSLSEVRPKMCRQGNRRLAYLYVQIWPPVRRRKGAHPVELLAANEAAPRGWLSAQKVSGYLSRSGTVPGGAARFHPVVPGHVHSRGLL